MTEVVDDPWADNPAKRAYQLVRFNFPEATDLDDELKLLTATLDNFNHVGWRTVQATQLGADLGWLVLLRGAATES